ncbi:protein FAM222B [Synchiropus picturatus]
MLACLPASSEPHILKLLSRSQMNTGLQKWETTQKMRSANYPTPAELDAYAKKVANSPLTIQIFPNSVKVPQRKHIRRTVNGLDTSSSSQRHSPYHSQVSASGGLLAVLRAPAKSIFKETDGGRIRQLHKATMNPHSGAYAAHSTLNLPQHAPHLPDPSQPLSQAALKQGMMHSQQQGMAHPMTLHQPQSLQNSQALQQRNMAHAQALQRQQSLTQVQPGQQQRLAQAPGMQRPAQALPPQERPPPVPPQQHLSHLPTLKHQTAPQALLSQQSVTQDLCHMSEGTQLQGLQHNQGLVSSQLLPQTVGGGPPNMPGGLQQAPPGMYGPRKLPDADAPPNVTVSTSTIPLSMAASLHQNRPTDLSSIVHQINQLCQARAGMGGTSVCEGQIANPSPISRNLLINASTRVSSHHMGVGSMPSCLLMGNPDKTPALAGPSVALHSQPNTSAANSLPAFHSDAEKVQLQQQQQLQQHLQQQKQQQHIQQLQQLQHQQQQQRSWAQHQLSHMQQPPEGAHPCKNPRMDPPAECSFPSQNLTYPRKMPNTAQSFPLKHPPEKTRPTSPVNCPVGTMPYVNGQYMQPQWSGLPGPAGNNVSGAQEIPLAFQGQQPAASAGRVPGAKYRPGKEAPAGQSKLMPNVEYLSGDFQMPGFREQNMHAIEKMHRSAVGQDPANGSGIHAHHPGYR